MAVLSDADRVVVWIRFMRDASAQGSLLTINKPELREAVDAIDSWVNLNATTFNLAIPQPARSELTARQKVWLLEQVVRRRFEIE